MSHLAPSLFFVALTAGAAPLKSQRDAELQVSVVTAADGGVTAHSTRATLRLGPNVSRAPSVGMLSSSAAGAGPLWLTTLWQATLVATEATESNLTGVEVTLRAAEPLDAPAPGMLTAAAFTALLRNKKLLPHTTIVGALNPDGSMAPVAELLPRLHAAAADGVKRFGFPLGARQQPGPTGVVDVVAEAQRLGVEAKELAALDDAYRFLTGDTLPRPAIAKESDMELWPVELTALRRLMAQVRQELDAERPQLDPVLARLDATAATTLRTRLERTLQRASELEQNGDPVRALVVLGSALTLMRALALDAQLAQAIEAHDTDGVFALLKPHQDAYPLERQALLRDVAERFPTTTRANDLYAMDILESVVTQELALSAQEDAAALRAMDPADPAFGLRAREHAEDLVRGREELRNGRRFFTLYGGLPKMKKTFAPVDAARLAAVYVLSGAAWRATLAAHPPTGLESDDTAVELAGYEALLATESDPRAKLVLAARQTLSSAHLSNLATALGAALDDKGAFSLRNKRALTAQLDQAKLRALQSCGRAKRELGLIPLAARTRYLDARAAREGSDQQKAESLAELWFAGWWCELAVRSER